MLNLKRFSKMLISLTLASSLFIGCSTKVEQIKTVRLSTPEEVVEMFNKNNLSNNIVEMVQLYSDVYIDSTGVDLNYINNLLNKNRKNVDIVQSELISMEDVNDDIKKATIEISANINNEKTTEQYVYAIVKEEEGWAISPDGVIYCENFEAGQYDKDVLNLALGKRIELLDAGMIRVSVLNNSKKDYTFGTESNKAEVIVQSETESISTIMEEPAIVEEGLNSYFLSRIDGITGKITKVTITNIYEIDGKQNPIEDTKQDIVVYEE